jgi:hypothetical protein
MSGRGPMTSPTRAALAPLLAALTACASSGGGTTAEADVRPPRATREAVDAAQAKEGNTGHLVAYPDPTDPSTMLNAFDTPAGLVAVWTYAVPEGSRYAGERFQVSLLGTKMASEYDPAVSTAHSLAHTGVYVTVTPLPEGDSEIYVSTGGGERRFHLRLSDLVRWRVRCITERVEVGERTLLHAVQGWDASHLWFEQATLDAALDPEAPWRKLTPAWVTPMYRRGVDGKWTKLREAPIGDTGYVLRRNDDRMSVELAR